MNFLRSKLNSYKEQITTLQTAKKPNNQLAQTKRQVFESLKQWDKERVQILKKHLQIIEQILNNLQIRVRNSQQYILSIEGILKARLKQLETYKNNSLNNSTFVLMNTQMPGYQESYDLLKELVMFEAQKDDKMTKKYLQLKQVFAQLYDFQNKDSQKDINISQQASISPNKKDTTSDKRIPAEEEQSNQLDESSVVMLKSNIRYLIDCQLPDINEEASRWCQQINKTYHNQSSTLPSNDISILITKFLNATRKQVQKHREIGKQILNLNKDFIERQKKRSSKVKYILSEWVRVDENANEVLIKQLQKEGNQNLIEDYYSLDDLIQADGLEIKNTSIEEYLLHVNVKPFQRGEELVLFHSDAFYNKKIETQIIITIDRFCHLKKPNQQDPQFSFTLTKDIYIIQEEEFVFKIEKMEKKFMKSAQKQFEFHLEFNIGEDIQKFLEVLEEMQWVNLKCL